MVDKQENKRRKLFDEIGKKLDASAEAIERDAEAIVEREKKEWAQRTSIDQKLYGLSKAWLEFARNFLVVCVLSYAASKSGKWYLTVFAWLTQLALIGFLFSYIVKYIDWFARPESPQWARAVLFVLFMVAGFGLLVVIGFINTAIDEMVAAQSR